MSVTHTSVVFQIAVTLYTFTSLNRYDIMHPQHFPYYTFRETLFFISIFNQELDQILLVSKTRSWNSALQFSRQNRSGGERSNPQIFPINVDGTVNFRFHKILQKNSLSRDCFQQERVFWVTIKSNFTFILSKFPLQNKHFAEFRDFLQRR